MNAKIFVGAAVGALAVIIGIVALSGSSVIDNVSEEGSLLEPTDNTTSEVLPLDVELDDISILQVSETAATIQISFKVSNPNSRSILLHLLNYKLYENDIRISTGNIGERPGGGMPRVCFSRMAVIVASDTSCWRALPVCAPHT